MDSKNRIFQRTFSKIFLRQIVLILKVPFFFATLIVYLVIDIIEIVRSKVINICLLIFVFLNYSHFVNAFFLIHQ